MVKVVLDANVLISAAFGGVPLDAVGKALSGTKVYLSPEIVSEVELTIRILSSKLGPEKTRILESLWKRLKNRCEMVEPAGKMTICREPKDDAYLSLCASIGAEYLVTGDKDLLSVEPARASGLLRNLKILTPRQFVELEI